MGDLKAEARTCSKCKEKPLRSNNTSGICSDCKYPWQRSRDRPKLDSDDNVLDRMGFGALNKRKGDEPPKPRPAAPRAQKPPKPEPIAVPLGRNHGELIVLATALGLDGDRLVEDFCGAWVERARRKALAPDQPLLEATNAPT